MTEQPRWLSELGEGGAAGTARIRRARALVITYDDGGIVVRNFLQKTAFECPPRWLGALAELSDWRARTEIVHHLSELGFDSPDEQIDRIVLMGGLVQEGTDIANHDEHYAAAWPWKEVGGLFHFGTSREEYGNDEEEQSWMVFRSITEERPTAYVVHGDGEGLTASSGPPDDGIFNTIKVRRSARNYLDKPVARDDLFSVLFSGLAITAIADVPVAGKIPLKTAPSAGGRTPYEGFVDVINVEGLDPGMYHYSSLQRTLKRLPGDAPSASAILGGQEWADPAGAIILLVASFDRAAYRYANPRGYRGVLVEAGHIAQNMLLAATQLGLASVPVQALDDAVVEAALGLDSITQAALHAVVIGMSDTDAEYPWPLTAIT